MTTTPVSGYIFGHSSSAPALPSEDARETGLEQITDHQDIHHEMSQAFHAGRA